MKFRTTILSNGKTATGARVPDEVVAALGQAATQRCARPSTATRTPAVSPPWGECSCSRLAPKYGPRPGVAAGDEVDIEIALDTAPREVVVPPDFAEALQGDAAAGAVFAGLSYSKQRRFVLSVEGAKTAETRSGA